MATEFLHLPKIPLHATPAREGGPHAQAGTNQLGFLSPGVATLKLCGPQRQEIPTASRGKPSQTATDAELKTGAKQPLVPLMTKEIR